jgi:hypothetical protein
VNARPPLPTDLPPKAAGVNAFGCVEAILLRGRSGGGLARHTPVPEVAQRIVDLHAALANMLPFSPDQNLVVSLYAWHGCMHMAKLLRCFANAPGGRAMPYGAQMRKDGYAHIRGE